MKTRQAHHRRIALGLAVAAIAPAAAEADPIDMTGEDLRMSMRRQWRPRRRSGSQSSRHAKAASQQRPRRRESTTAGQPGVA